jgi:periplasmic protein TonB
VLSSATVPLRRAIPVAASCGLHGLVLVSVLTLGSVWGASEPRVLFAELIPLEIPPPPPPITPPPKPVLKPIPEEIVAPRLVKAPEQPLPVAAEPPAVTKEAAAPPPPPIDPVVPPPPQPAVAAPEPAVVPPPVPASGGGPMASAEAHGGALAAPGPPTDSGTLPSGAPTAGGGGGPAPVSSARVSPGSGDGVTRTARPSGGYQVHPPYPPSARRAGAQGTTLLRVYVAHDGRVGEIVVQESAGHPDLDRAATDAVARWRFEPARRGTEAVGMWVLLPVQFQLR